MVDREQLLRIEWAAIQAWPALAVRNLDGWLWRYSQGGSQRANSVAALDYTGGAVETAIDEVERRYRLVNAVAMFQISDVAAPTDLDARLAARGYGIREPCITLVKATDKGVRAPPDVVYFESARPDWFACYASVITPARRAVAPQILARIPQPSTFCGVVRDGVVAATALAVAHGGIVIAECVATLAEARRTGAAAAVMRGVETWGADRGCSLSALQAVAANDPAQALYRSLGYRPAGGYHMRVLAQP